MPTILIFRSGRPVGHLRKEGRTAAFERWVAISLYGEETRHASRRDAIRSLEASSESEAGETRLPEAHS
jgi:hypothetical protein